MTDNGLFLPVHRPLPQKVLESVLQESEFAREACGVSVPVLVLDEARNSEIARRNRELCIRIRENHPQAELYFVPMTCQRMIAADIANSTQVNPKLLVGTSRAYGKMFNMIFIVGRLAGINTFHRRDSDVFMQQINGRNLPPIELELRYLRQQHKGETINIVGSNYVGEPNIRLDESMKNDDFIRKYIQSWGTPADDDETIRQLTAYMYNEVPYTGDAETLSGLWDYSYVDGGNVGFTDYVYEIIPNAPNEDLTGTDYYLFSLAEALRLGVLVHGRRLMHDHGEEEVTVSGKIRYWEDIMYNSDTTYVYFKAFDEIQRRADRVKADPRFPVSFREEFVASLRAARDTDREKRLSNLEHLSDALLSTGESIYRDIALKFRRDKYEDVFNSVTRNTEEYIGFIERWDDILVGQLC